MKKIKVKTFFDWCGNKGISLSKLQKKYIRYVFNYRQPLARWGRIPGKSQAQKLMKDFFNEIKVVR